MKQQVTQDTTDDQRGYALPTAGDTDWADAAAGTVRKYKSDISLELINNDAYRVPLTKRHKQDIELDSDFKDTEANGKPTAYCIAEGNIELYKLPHSDSNDDVDFTMNFEFYGYLADLSGDSDTNTITNDYPEVLEYGATALGFRFGHDIEMAEYYEGKMYEILGEMISTDQIEEYGTIETGLQPQDGQEVGA
jgi:hypothetical protein